MKVLSEAFLNGYKIAIVVIDEAAKTVAEAVWVNGHWETDVSYPTIGINPYDVAGELDFNKVREMGYEIID